MARQPKFSRVDDTTFRNAGGGGATVALSASRMGTRNSGGKPTSSRLATSAERLLAACKHSISPAGSLRRNEQDVEVDNETTAGREETAAGGRIEDARLHRLGERRATAFVCGIFRKMHTVIVRAVREVCAFLFSWTWFKVEVRSATRVPHHTGTVSTRRGTFALGVQKSWRSKLALGMGELPTELLIPVFTWLTVTEIGHVARTCRQCASAARSEMLWRSIGASHVVAPSNLRGGRFRSAVLRAIREPRDWAWRGDYEAFQRMASSAGRASSVFTALALANQVVACGASNGSVTLFRLRSPGPAGSGLDLEKGVAVGGLALLGQVTALTLSALPRGRQGAPPPSRTDNMEGLGDVAAFELVAAGASGALVVADFDARAGLAVPDAIAVPHPHRCPISSILPPPSGGTSARLGVTADVEGRAALWDWATKTHLAPLWSPHPGASVSALAWAPEERAPNGALLASGGFDAAVCLWDVRAAVASLAGGESAPDAGTAPVLVARCRLPSSAYRVYDVAWHPTGALLAAACGDGAVRLLGSRPWAAAAPSGPRTMVRSHSGPAALASQRSLNLQAPAPLPILCTLEAPSPFPSWVRSVAFMCAGRALAAGGGDGRVRMWDITAALRSATSSQPAASQGRLSRGGSSSRPPPSPQQLPQCAYLGTLDTHAGPILRLAAEGDVLASISTDESLVVRRYARTEERCTPGAGGLAPVAPSGLFLRLAASRASRGLLSRSGGSRAGGGAAAAASQARRSQQHKGQQRGSGGAGGGSVGSFAALPTLYATVGDAPVERPPSLSALLGSCELLGGLALPPSLPSSPLQRQHVAPPQPHLPLLDHDHGDVGLDLDAPLEAAGAATGLTIASSGAPLASPGLGSSSTSRRVSAANSPALRPARGPEVTPPLLPPSSPLRLAVPGVSSPLARGDPRPGLGGPCMSSISLDGEGARQPTSKTQSDAAATAMMQAAQLPSSANSALRAAATAAIGVFGRAALRQASPLYSVGAAGRRTTVGGGLRGASVAGFLDSVAAAPTAATLRDDVAAKAAAVPPPHASRTSEGPRNDAMQRISRAVGRELARAAQTRFPVAADSRPRHTYIQAASAFGGGLGGSSTGGSGTVRAPMGAPAVRGRGADRRVLSPVRFDAAGSGTFRLNPTETLDAASISASLAVSPVLQGVAAPASGEREHVRVAGGERAVVLPPGRAIPPGWSQGASLLEHDKQLLLFRIPEGLRGRS